MGIGRKRATRRPHGHLARGLLWAALAGGVVVGLLGGCPPAGGAGGPAVVRATPTPAGDPFQRELGRAFIAAARAYQALGLGDAAGARRALDDAEEQLRAARDATTPDQARRVLQLEDRLIVARAALARGGPGELLAARGATKALLDGLLAVSPLEAVPPELVAQARASAVPGPQVAAPPSAPPAGGGAGAGTPASSAPSGPKPLEVRRALARGFVSLAAARREIISGHPTGAVPHVRAARLALRSARIHGTLAQQRRVAALDLRANQLAYMAGRASPRSLASARGLTADWLAVEDAFAAPVRAARPAVAPRRAAAAPATAAGGGAGGSAPQAPKVRRTPPADPTLTTPW